MKKKLKRYKVSPDNSLCFAVSVVDKPATESDFLFFNKQEVEKFVGVDGERRMIYGCAMRADYPIYRNNKERGEYYLEFDKEAIDKLSKNYFKMQFQNKWTEAHQEEVEGLTITESWIKEDMYKDKSIALGLDPNIEVGSWFIGCYCENDDIWQKVKAGTYRGFSCEAFISLEEFETQINNNDNDSDMNEEMLFSKIKNLIKDFFKGNSDVDTEESEASKITPIEEKLEEETPTVAEPQNEPTPEPQNETKVEEPIVVKEEPKEAIVEPTVVEKPNPLEDLVKSLKEEVEALKKMNSSLDKKVKEMSKEPSAPPVNVKSKSSGGDNYAQWRQQMSQMLGHY